MTAREELRELRTLSASIDALIADKKQIRARMVSLCRPLAEPISGTKRSDLSDSVAHLLDLEKEIGVRIRTYVCMKRHVVSKIGKIRERNLRILLYQHYACGIPLYRVAERMNYSYDWAKRAHQRALLAYEAIGERVHPNTPQDLL